MGPRKADLNRRPPSPTSVSRVGKNGSKWKHEYIPLNAAALLLKRHGRHGGTLGQSNGKSSGSRLGKAGATIRAAVAGPPPRLTTGNMPDLKRLDDKSLERLMSRPAEDAVYERIAAELDHRQSLDEAFTAKPAGGDGWAAEQADFDKHGGLAGMQARAGSMSPATQRDKARQSFDEFQHSNYLRAESATRGAMLSRAGKAHGIDPAGLLDGTLKRSEVRRYASEELLRWLGEPGNSRRTFTEYLADYTGWQSTRGATIGRHEMLSQFG